MDEHHHRTADSEAEIWNAIAAFEKILEAIPNDRMSLETLADAYEKVGDQTRAKEYLFKLANTLIAERDEDAARDLRRKIQIFAAHDPQAQDIIARIDSLEPDKVMALVLDGESKSEPRSANISNEISFAWELLQAKKISQDDYTNIIHDLTEQLSIKNATTISVLHVLRDRHYPGLNDIMAFAATHNNMPMISLLNYESQPRLASLLPYDFMVRRGAIIFELMGDDALAGILNPFDPQLPADLENITGKICHCFLVTPDDFDRALGNIKQMLEP